MKEGFGTAYCFRNPWLMLLYHPQAVSIASSCAIHCSPSLYPTIRRWWMTRTTKRIIIQLVPKKPWCRNCEAHSKSFGANGIPVASKQGASIGTMPVGSRRGTRFVQDCRVPETKEWEALKSFSRNQNRTGTFGSLGQRQDQTSTYRSLAPCVVLVEGQYSFLRHCSVLTILSSRIFSSSCSTIYAVSTCRVVLSSWQDSAVESRNGAVGQRTGRQFFQGSPIGLSTTQPVGSLGAGRVGYTYHDVTRSTEGRLDSGTQQHGCLMEQKPSTLSLKTHSCRGGTNEQRNV